MKWIRNFLTTMVVMAIIATGSASAQFVSTQADWEPLGLDSDSQWTSVHSQTVVTWDTALWQFPFDREDAIISDPAYSQDTISLVTIDDQGLAHINVFAPPSAITPDAYLEVLSSEENLANISGTQYRAEVVDSATTENTASIIIRLQNDSGLEYFVICDTYIGETEHIVSYIYAEPEYIGDVYQAFWDGVQANGDYYPLTWTLEEIHAYADE